MSSADMDVDMQDAHPSRVDGEEHENTGPGSLRYPAHVDDAASSDDSTRPFAGRYKRLPSGTPRAQPQRSQPQRFSHACATIIEKWNHDLLHLLPDEILPKDAGTRHQPRQLNLMAWPRTLVWELADLARLGPDVEAAAEHLLAAHKKRFEVDPRNPHKKLTPGDVRKAKTAVRKMGKAKRESKSGQSVTGASAAMSEIVGSAETLMHVARKEVGKERVDDGEKMVLPIIGGRRH